jgi:hypothetical protein
MSCTQAREPLCGHGGDRLLKGLEVETVWCIQLVQKCERDVGRKLLEVMLLQIQRLCIMCFGYRVYHEGSEEKDLKRWDDHQSQGGEGLEEKKSLP